jgi:hypothetical protein
MSRALPIFLLVAFTVFAFVDCALTSKTQVNRKWLWLTVILLVPVIGPLSWFLAGRPRTGPGRAPRRDTPPVAPDDDPDFLRRLWPPNDPRDIA